MNLLTGIRRDTGKFVNSFMKRGIVLDLETPVGVVAVIASGAVRLDSMLNLITSALVSGNALVLCVADVLCPAIQTLVKYVYLESQAEIALNITNSTIISLEL